MTKVISVIIRTYNESRYLDELLQAIRAQEVDGFNVEAVIVDSGSTDSTLDIAEKHNSRITHIKKSDFTFGRSLNIGCDFSLGDILVFVSGHCIPTDDRWLINLVGPILQETSEISYGRQIGRDTTKFSEKNLLGKYFPPKSSIPQEGFFCNNANCAISRATWATFRYDESLTGLEDMDIAKKVCDGGGTVSYVADSLVYHIHDETWSQVKNRYEREAIALRHIHPEVHISFLDMVNFILVCILKDFHAALRQGVFLREFSSVLKFRILQYYGSYRGNHMHRKLSRKSKMKYFYPRVGR